MIALFATTKARRHFFSRQFLAIATAGIALGTTNIPKFVAAYANTSFFLGQVKGTAFHEKENAIATGIASRVAIQNLVGTFVTTTGNVITAFVVIITMVIAAVVGTAMILIVGVLVVVVVVLTVLVRCVGCRETRHKNKEGCRKGKKSFGEIHSLGVSSGDKTR